MQHFYWELGEMYILRRGCLHECDRRRRGCRDKCERTPTPTPHGRKRPKTATNWCEENIATFSVYYEVFVGCGGFFGCKKSIGRVFFSAYETTAVEYTAPSSPIGVPTVFARQSDSNSSSSRQRKQMCQQSRPQPLKLCSTLLLLLMRSPQGVGKAGVVSCEVLERARSF